MRTKICFVLCSFYKKYFLHNLHLLHSKDKKMYNILFINEYLFKMELMNVP